METARKEGVAVPTTQALHLGAKGSNVSSRQHKSFPQRLGGSARLGQENAIMSPQAHDNDAATAGFALWMFPTFGTVSWRYGAIFGLWRDS